MILNKESFIKVIDTRNSSTDKSIGFYCFHDNRSFLFQIKCRPLPRDWASSDEAYNNGGQVEAENNQQQQDWIAQVSVLRTLLMEARPLYTYK